MHTRFLTASVFALLAVFVLFTAFMHPAGAQGAKPTIVLVHGAFAESSSWNGVAGQLLARGYPVVAVANPLRGLRNDAEYVSNVVRTIQGPVVLVGHSYGGSVISNVPGQGKVKAHVYVAAFALEQGESTVQMSERFPGGTLGPTLAAPVVLSDGGKDLYIQQDKFGEQFAADVPARQSRIEAATQRPITEAALGEPSGAPAWKAVPSWHIYGDADKNIPPQAMKFMAERAGSRETVVLKGASHVPMISQPEAVATLIEHAASWGLQ
jgi:pimeloyl-ACP methyl ester carboxylesterase